MAETYGRYDLAMGCRRTAASPSYEIGRRATGGGSETDERDRGGHSWGIIPICRERVVELGNWIKSSPKRPPRSRALRPAQSGCPDTPEISRGKTDRTSSPTLRSPFALDHRGESLLAPADDWCAAGLCRGLARCPVGHCLGHLKASGGRSVRPRCPEPCVPSERSRGRAPRLSR
jgi:hypothetical protein